MPDLIPGNPYLHVLNEVDSTNNYAMARINEGEVKHGTAWMTLHQTSGKGQRGRRWESNPGENILMSIVMRPRLMKISEQFLLSAAVALGTYDFVKNFGGASTKIKWSNDLYIHDKKAGGILIENVIRGNDWKYAIAGLGINVNQENFPSNLLNPVSLFQITGKKYDVLQLGKDLYYYVMNRIAPLISGKKNNLSEEYCACLYHMGKNQKFSSGNKPFEAIIEGVETDGRLILKRGGKTERFAFGEISFVI